MGRSSRDGELFAMSNKCVWQPVWQLCNCRRIGSDDLCMQEDIAALHPVAATRNRLAEGLPAVLNAMPADSFDILRTHPEPALLIVAAAATVDAEDPDDAAEACKDLMPAAMAEAAQHTNERNKQLAGIMHARVAQLPAH